MTTTPEAAWARLMDLADTADVIAVAGENRYVNGRLVPTAAAVMHDMRDVIRGVHEDWTHRVRLIAEHAAADGPGKYEGNAYRRAASYVHSLTLGGWTAEECGTVEYGPGWHGLVHFDARAADDVRALGWAPDVDAAPDDMLPAGMVRPASAIVHEDSQGFVSVAFYDSEDSALADWSEIQGACDAAEDDDEDDE